MRISQERIHASLKSQIEKVFVNLLVDLKNDEESKQFLKDFFTQSELETYTKRLAIAYWLKKGRSYANIKQNLKVSSATIASVTEIADKTGIKLAIKKIEAEEWANQWTEKISQILPLGKKKLAKQG